MDLLLSTEERNRFASWLEHEASTAKGIIAQLEKLGPGMQVMVVKERKEAEAALIIAHKLRSTHSETL